MQGDFELLPIVGNNEKPAVYYYWIGNKRNWLKLPQLFSIVNVSQPFCVVGNVGMQNDDGKVCEKWFFSPCHLRVFIVFLHQFFVRMMVYHNQLYCSIWFKVEKANFSNGYFNFFEALFNNFAIEYQLMIKITVWCLYLF